MHAQGVNFIKVYEMVQPEVFDALTEIAGELDLPIDSHCLYPCVPAMQAPE